MRAIAKYSKLPNIQDLKIPKIAKCLTWQNVQNSNLLKNAKCSKWRNAQNALKLKFSNAQMAKCSRAQMLQTAIFSAYINSKNRPKLPIGVMKVRVKFRASRTDVKRCEMGSRPYHYLGVACNATEPQSIKEVFFSQACLKRHYIIGQALRYTCTGDRLLRTCPGCFSNKLIFCVSGTARFLSFS